MQVWKSWEELLYFLPKHSQKLFLITYQFLRLHVVVLCPAYLDVLQMFELGCACFPKRPGNTHFIYGVRVHIYWVVGFVPAKFLDLLENMS